MCFVHVLHFPHVLYLQEELESTFSTNLYHNTKLSDFVTFFNIKILGLHQPAQIHKSLKKL